MSEPRQPFGQSTAGVLIIQGLIGPAIGAIIGVFLTLALTQSKSVPWTTVAIVAVVAAAVVFLLLSIFLRRLRSLIWGNVRRFFVWLFGLRLTTRARREALDSAGYSRRDEEVKVERARAFEPTWRIDARDRMGTKDLFWLENSGFEVFDVALACDPASFVLEAEASWEGSFGTDQPGGLVGKWFKGKPTERGRDEGVPFTVTWTDRNGDKRKRVVMMPAAEMKAGDKEERDDIWAEGRAYGRKEAMEEKRPAVPLPTPRWSVHRADGEDTLVILHNSVDRSVAREVRLESANFDFHDGAHWEEISGVADGEFNGVANLTGYDKLVRFEISWYDENGVQHGDTLWMDPDDWTPF
jgi:hypothetical protein